ncbi:cyanophycinase [Cypionkella sp.]|uniref:cyanophycinase n=1 Tax=Cypionkella sp. TaxID=2811411 RepID=UPI0026263EE5|nr:cyanophycinase [Cypionkella sp.]MDB5667040.1 cyanophycinase [Cypionkella sp.]
MTKARKSRPGDGTLVIIGGHEDHDGDRLILKEVAGLIPDGRLVLATIASDEPEGYLEKYRNTFGELGVNDVSELYVRDRPDASNEEHIRLLDDIRAVFFSGGDQLRITSQIGGSAIGDRIMAIYRDGGLIAGTSAGASMMSETMLVKGSSSSSFRTGDVRMAPGLGLLPNVIIDQHFAERGRIGRLIGAVSQNPRELGIGIDEDTAIVVQNEEFRVIGSGGVYLVDASGVTHSDVADAETSTTASVHDLKLHVLSAGDRFDLRTRRPIAEARSKEHS